MNTKHSTKIILRVLDYITFSFFVWCKTYAQVIWVFLRTSWYSPSICSQSLWNCSKGQVSHCCLWVLEFFHSTASENACFKVNMISSTWIKGNKKSPVWSLSVIGQKSSNKVANLIKTIKTSPHNVLIQNIIPALLVSYQWFTGTLENIANKMAAPFFHCLPANEAKMIHVTNALKKIKTCFCDTGYI